MKYQLLLTIAFCAGLTASAQKLPYQTPTFRQKSVLLTSVED